jgi:membrane protease YdiL (CAAX protease family)
VMWVVLPYLLPLAIVIFANLGETRSAWRVLTYVCLALVNVVTFLIGLLILAVPFLSRLTQVPLSPALEGFAFAGVGLAALTTATLGMMSLVTPFRRLLARYVHIDPNSLVHTTALVFLLYFSTTSLGALLGAGEWLSDSEELASSSTWTVVSGQAIFLLFALLGTGLGVRRNVRQALQRLGLGRLSARFLGIAVLAVLAFLSLDYVTALLWHRIWPSNYESIMGTSQQLFARFATPLGALILALAAGIGEETLFRGALQPVFRVPLTALVFTLGHVQYGLSPATAEVLLIGLALGWLRDRSNTTTCMAVHVAYNFLDLLILPLFP